MQYLYYLCNNTFNNTVPLLLFGCLQPITKVAYDNVVIYGNSK